MKKTFFALALLGALNLAYGQGSVGNQDEDIITLTFSNAATTNEDHISEGYGIAFTLGNNLDKTRVTTTATQGGSPLTTIPTFSSVELQSITLKVYGNNWSTFSTKAYIADQATKTVTAISSTTVSNQASGSMVTFDFGNTVLSSNTSYLLIFANSTTALPEVGKSALADNGNIWANRRGFATVGNDLTTSASSQLGFCTNKGAINATAYSPIVAIQATTKNVPEPSASALGLLALGGLAARRRRK